MAEIRFGYISDFDAKKMQARVTFPDYDDIVSDWLPIIINNSKKTKAEHYLDVNEHVACVFLDDGIEAGAILGAIYDDDNKPEISDENVQSVLFSDGTLIKHDRLNKICLIQDSFGSLIKLSDGNIEISAPNNIKINASRIDLN